MNGIFNNEKECVLKNKCRSAALTLIRHGDKIPQERKDLLLNRIKETLGIDVVNLEEVSQMWMKADVRTQGKIVVEALTGGVEEFIYMWRAHFIEKMSPKFLPKNWRIDRPIAMR